MTDDLDPVALLAGTTPGPWESDGEGVWTPATESEHRVGGLVALLPLNRRPAADARLLAKAPELAAALVEARKENERLRAHVADVIARCEKRDYDYAFRTVAAWLRRPT